MQFAYCPIPAKREEVLLGDTYIKGCHGGNRAGVGLIPGLERSPGGGPGKPFQHSCLENLGTEEPGGLQSIK